MKNNIKRTLILSISIFCLLTNIGAQLSLTLKSCIEMGLENNYALQIVRNQQQASSNSATIANAGYLPSVDLTSGYSVSLDNISTKERESGNTTSNNGVFDQTTNVGANLVWTIFDGFSIQANYNKLKELKLRSEVDTRITIEQYIANLAAEYYNFVRQKHRLKNLRYAIELSKERLRIVQTRYAVGNFSRLDYQQAKVDFNTDSADYIKQQVELISSRIALNELMALSDVNARVVIPDSAINPNLLLDYQTLINATDKTNAELIRAKQGVKLAQLDYKKIISRYYPYLKLNTGYGYTYNRYGANTNISRGNLGFNAGVTVGINLFSGSKQSERRNAKLDIANARLEEDNVELALHADFSRIWQSYQNNIELLVLEKSNLSTARDNYEIAMERYMLGDLSGVEMREAQKSLLDAEERILSAQYNTKLCEISLYQISGTITTYLQ